MNMKFKKLDEWRKFFHRTKASLFDMIDNAIIVAAKDHPEEFKNRRGLIAENVYSCQLTKRCSHCHNELDIIEEAIDDNSNDECESGGARSMLNASAGDSEPGCIKDSDVDRSRDDHSEFNHDSYSEAEALVAEIDEKEEDIGEALRIINILHNSQDESEKVLHDCLTRLQLMSVSVDILQATEIEKAVTALQSHKSESVKSFARRLIEDWSLMENDYLAATAAIAVDEVGFPFPPLNEITLFTTQQMELSQIFDEIDDNGNPVNSTEIDKNRENERTTLPENPNNSKQQSQFTKEENRLFKDDKCQPINQRAKMKLLANAMFQEKVGARKNKLPEGNQQAENAKKQKSAQFIDLQEPVTKLVKPTSTNRSNIEYAHGRFHKQDSEQKTNNETGSSQICPYGITMHKKPLTEQQAKLTSPDDATVQAKLEATRRKLKENYQEVENARKERTIQVMDLHELPKQELGHRNQHFKRKYHYQHWANERHKF